MSIFFIILGTLLIINLLLFQFSSNKDVQTNKTKKELS